MASDRSSAKAGDEAEAQFKPKVAVIGGGIAGVSAAWSLHRSGYPVELFERNQAIGGNARTFRWSLESGEAESPLLVFAWPEKLYHNYERLLEELGLETTSMPISYFVRHPQGIFCQDGRTELHERLAGDFRRWDCMVRVTRRINEFFLPKDHHESLYHFSFLNPLNVIPLYPLMRIFGISRRFWDAVFVPIHCASLITTSMKSIPAVVAPLLEGIVPLERPCRMGTWADSPRHVFERMTESFRDCVHTGCEVIAVRRRGGIFEIEDVMGETFTADRVIFACQTPSILAAIEKPTWLVRALLGRVRYVDDIDPTFSRFRVHSDASLFPEEHRDRILSEFNTYTEVDDEGHLECTFVVSAHTPTVRGLGRAMLVTFNSKKTIGKIEAEIELPNATPVFSLGNLARMLMVRFLQGRNGLYYCGSFTTPEGGHDLSFLSGLVAARMIGAEYPFPLDDSPAVADYHQMQRIMLGRVLPDIPLQP